MKSFRFIGHLRWLLLLSFASSLALAQREEENGIRVGEGRLHPYVRQEIRYDSAAGFFAAGGTTLGGEMVGHVTPGLRYNLLGSRWILDFDGKADYVRYLGAISPGSQNISRLEAGVDLSLIYGKEASVGFDLVDHFYRSGQTSNAALGVGALSLGNEIRVGAPIRPGGGALEVAPRFAFGFESFEPLTSVLINGCVDPSCDPAFVRSMNYYNLRPELEARWKFFPKTAVVFDSRMDFRRYNNTTNPPANLLKAATGVAGLISTKVAVVVKAGWGQDFAGTRAKTVIGEASVSYLLSETNIVKIGFLRTLEPVPIFGSDVDNRAYLDTTFLFSGRLNLHGAAAFDYLTFSGSSRNDKNVSLELAPEYQVARWLIVAVGYQLTMRQSSEAVASLNYTRHEPYLRVTLTY